MIYKKIENFFGEITNNALCPSVLGILFVVLSFPIWIPFWIISKFFDTPSR